MSATIIKLPQAGSVSEALRNIADQYEAGEYGDDPATLVIGREVFHFGTSGNEAAAANALFDLQLGIHKLMASALGG